MSETKRPPMEIVIKGPGGCAVGLMLEHVAKGLKAQFKAAEPYERSSIYILDDYNKKRRRLYYRAPKYKVRVRFSAEYELRSPRTVIIRVIEE